MTVAPGQLFRLTATKAVANTALRWLPFFLFVLEDAFDASTTQLALVLGIGEMMGLSTLLVGGQLDEGRERTFLVVAMILISGSGVIALGGTIWLFGLSVLLLGCGVSLVTVSGHTWLSRRVPFERRGRVIGIFEMSWASALLIGAPTIALTIELVGWRGPFALIAIASAAMAVVIARLPNDGAGPIDPNTTDWDFSTGRTFAARTWSLIGMSASIATAGLATIVVVGTWLEDSFSISTGRIGITAMAFGLAEITASGTSARFSDQLGKVRTTGIALVCVAVGLSVIMVAGTSFVVALVGLAVFFLGFEYAIVTSFSIVSEAAPHARGRVLAANNAVGTMARGSSTIASGFLFDRFGISGPATLSLVAAVLAIVLLLGGRSAGER